MANKTIYIADSDLYLWQSAEKIETLSGRSMSALFVEFLRERLKSMTLDTFVHVVHSTPQGSGSEDYAVMLGLVGQTGSGGPMQPHYARGSEKLMGLLEQIGLTREDAVKIKSDLQKGQSVSVRRALPSSSVKWL